MNELTIPSIPKPEVMDCAMKKFGKESQIDRFIEEASELIQALLKNHRTDTSYTQDEKLANVNEIHGDKDAIKESILKKVNRLEQKLKDLGAM